MNGLEYLYHLLFVEVDKGLSYTHLKWRHIFRRQLSGGWIMRRDKLHGDEACQVGTDYVGDSESGALGGQTSSPGE